MSHRVEHYPLERLEMGLVRIAALNLFIFLVSGENENDGITCNPNITIRDGTITLSKGGEVGSILRHICPFGLYPYPVISRICRRNGRWSLMRNDHGQIISKAECRAFKCPMPSIEQGTFFPSSMLYAVGDTVSFECDDGYSLWGLKSRTCMINGRWNGTTAVCQDGLDSCPNPGIPAGSMKSGTNYGFDDKVKYLCLNDLVLIGSNERICLETGEWSGSEPVCQHKYSFDLPEEVASYFSASFSRVLSESKINSQVKEKDESHGRKLILGQNHKLHIYILLDVSGSIQKVDFKKAINAMTTFVTMIKQFEVGVNYGLVMFGSRSCVEVNIAHDDVSDSDSVLQILPTLKYEDITRYSDAGTNMTGALKTIFEMMVLKKASMKDKQAEWREVRHAIMIFTDGRNNMGGNPKPMMDRIRNFLDIEKVGEEFLDVYGFGLGNDVDKEEINSVASKKNNERHVFSIQTEDLTTVFNSMLDLTSVGNLCGFANKSLTVSDQSSFPWYAEVRSNDNPDFRCSGSIVGDEWILTAAHCFEYLTEGNINSRLIFVGASGKKVQLKIDRVIKHPNYNLTGKVEMGIREFYDYDIALVKIKSKLSFTTNIRPICLPCTVGTSVALKISQTKPTCTDHEKELLPTLGTVEAKFIQKIRNHALKNVKIKIGASERALCEQDATNAAIYVNVSNVKDVVTDRFLCTGGSRKNPEAISCKGDSGGPLYIQKLYRYIQVGVVSWGVVNMCEYSNLPHHARDFHINLFKVLDWLKQHLGNSTRFLD
ncbi:complement factor B-like [Rhincodon typus]|uniref:complement factor B-like n=1 Tax=Rhincodon typus TaxID=259920 RepID=UPI00202F05AD|nr:complement factor B-like [Rhincodon typus]